MCERSDWVYTSCTMHIVRSHVVVHSVQYNLVPSKCKYWSANVWVACGLHGASSMHADGREKYTSNVIDSRRFIVSRSEKLERAPHTPTKCICINSDKTEERALHYLISLFHSYVIYIFENNCHTLYASTGCTRIRNSIPSFTCVLISHGT